MPQQVQVAMRNEQGHLGGERPAGPPGLALCARHRDGDVPQVCLSRFQIALERKGEDVGGPVEASEGPVQSSDLGIGGEQKRDPLTGPSRRAEERTQQPPACRNVGSTRG